MKKVTIVLGLLAIVSLALLVTTIKNTMAESEGRTSSYLIELRDGLTMTDSVEPVTNGIVTGAECWKRALYNEPCTINIEVEKPQRDLIGDIVSNRDGTTCWMIEEKVGTLYYKLIGDCPNA